MSLPPQHQIGRFTLRDMAQCGRALRQACDGAGSMEEAALTVVNYLYNGLVHESGGRACSLVRFFTTAPYSRLPADLQQVAAPRIPVGIDRDRTRCLTLLATMGDEPAWNDRRLSVGHRVIPLVSVEVVQNFPMVSRLITQLGFEISEVVAPDPALILNLDDRSFGVFYVGEALGSPFIVAQDDFVKPYGIKSVLGFGGMTPSGDMFAAIMFSKNLVPKETAEMFQTIALSIKLAVLPLSTRPLFVSQAAGATS